MAIYIAIEKVFEDYDKYIYEISEGAREVNCIAVIIPSKKTISFYKNDTLIDWLYTFIVHTVDEENPNVSLCGHEEYAFVLRKSLMKLIPAVMEGVFPKYLDKCS